MRASTLRHITHMGMGEREMASVQAGNPRRTGGPGGRRDDPDHPDPGEKDAEQPGGGGAGDQDAEEHMTERGDPQQESLNL